MDGMHPKCRWGGCFKQPKPRRNTRIATHPHPTPSQHSLTTPTLLLAGHPAQPRGASPCPRSRYDGSLKGLVYPPVQPIGGADRCLWPRSRTTQPPELKKFMDKKLSSECARTLPPCWGKRRRARCASRSRGRGGKRRQARSTPGPKRPFSAPPAARSHVELEPPCDGRVERVRPVHEPGAGPVRGRQAEGRHRHGGGCHGALQWGWSDAWHRARVQARMGAPHDEHGRMRHRLEAWACAHTCLAPLCLDPGLRRSSAATASS